MANEIGTKPLGFLKSVGLALGAAVAFTLAYSIPRGGFLMIGFLYCLLALAKFGTARSAFYLGLAVGMSVYSLQLWFFYNIFSAAAIVLWLILAFWIALFALIAHTCFARFKPTVAAILIPFVWTGVEYFRSELYYLRVSWLNVGYAFSDWRILPFQILGVYGAGFLFAGYATIFLTVSRKIYAVAAVLLSLGFFAFLLPATENSDGPGPRVQVAGVQLEFSPESQIILALNQLDKRFPQAELFVLSEYTFTEPIPERIRAWCRKHQRYLIVGGEDPATNGNYYDTAFVISTNGGIVFKQAKSVPIQFFKDGLPAQEQKLWNSPWGKIGICICYDLSYRRVTDRLIRLGAQAIIVPTMDVADWGRHEHELHTRIATIRAAEYGVPIFRVASSGISQLVDRTGDVQASAPFPGQIAALSGVLKFHKPGSLPLDRILAPFSVLVTVSVIGSLAFVSLRRKFSKPR